MTGASTEGMQDIWGTAQRLRDVRDASQRFLRLWAMERAIAKVRGDFPLGHRGDSPGVDLGDSRNGPRELDD